MQRAFASFNPNQTGAAFISGAPGKSIRVMAAFICGTTSTPVTFNTSTGNTPITPVIVTANNAPFILPQLNVPEGAGQGGWFDSAVGDGITITTGAGSTLGILVVYDLA